MRVLLASCGNSSKIGSPWSKMSWHSYGAKSDYISPHGIEVHSETGDPDKAHRMITAKWRGVKKGQMMDSAQPIESDKVRIVCISDTHCKTKNLVVPDGDILLHAGDFTARGRIEEVQAFAKFIAQQPHKHKVIIAGNHEMSFGYCDGYCNPQTFERLLGAYGAENIRRQMSELNIAHPKELLPDNAIYLDNSSATVCGLKIWGSAWTPYFHGWAYNARRGSDILRIWDTIPTDTDIVMTHGPPVGIGDLVVSGQRAGCVELLTTVTQRVKPKLHVFGHIHEGYGLFTDGTTQYANASTCTVMYRPHNKPICIDIPLPEGFTKDDAHVDPIQTERLLERQFPEAVLQE